MRRVAGLLLVMMLLASCGGGDKGPLIVGLPYSDYSHEDEPFARKLYAEHSSIPSVDDPDVFYRTKDLALRYTHVVDGSRVTPGAVSGAPMVWFFGGSTMFGIGQRDGHTIAADVARLAADAGTPIDVRNYGASGYVAWQETALLKKMMASEERPDLIVFLHGLNDYSQTCRHLAVGVDPLSHTNPATDPPLDDDDEPVVACWDDPEATGGLIAKVIDVAMAAADVHADGVPVTEFWQAIPEARAANPSNAGLMERISEDRSDFKKTAQAYQAAIAADQKPGIDLTDVFDDYDGPVFFDWAHTNELGARMVAEAMWERSLREQVAKLD